MARQPGPGQASKPEPERWALICDSMCCDDIPLIPSLRVSSVSKGILYVLMKSVMIEVDEREKRQNKKLGKRRRKKKRRTMSQISKRQSSRRKRCCRPGQRIRGEQNDSRSAALLSFLFPLSPFLVLSFLPFSSSLGLRSPRDPVKKAPVGLLWGTYRGPGAFTIAEKPPLCEHGLLPRPRLGSTFLLGSTDGSRGEEENGRCAADTSCLYESKPTGSLV